MNRMKALLIVTLSCLIWHAGAQGQRKPSTSNHPCGELTMFDSHPLTDLALGVQRQLREAVRPDILAIIHDPGMGIDTKLRDIKLDAVQIPRPAKTGSLYAVHWGDARFGVNGGIWIVEVKVKANRARNIGPQNPGWSFNGMGMQVLSSSNEPYPELMFASKGFHEAGGPEAEAVCTQKQGPTYTSASCPVGCSARLNAR